MSLDQYQVLLQGSAEVKCANINYIHLKPSREKYCGCPQICGQTYISPLGMSYLDPSTFRGNFFLIQALTLWVDVMNIYPLTPKLKYLFSRYG